MKRILTACGYNHAWAFKEIDEDKILQLEGFLQTRHRKIADSFEEYKDVDPFEFLPGHRSLIFGIKAQILSFENSKKPKLKSGSTASSTNVSGELELRQNLIDQLSNFSVNNSIKFDCNTAIQSFEFEKTGDEQVHATSSVLCSICDTVRVLRFNKYWRVSNYYKHLRSHFSKNQQSAKKSNRSTDPNQGKNKSNNNELSNGESSNGESSNGGMSSNTSQMNDLSNDLSNSGDFLVTVTDDDDLIEYDIVDEYASDGNISTDE